MKKKVINTNHNGIEMFRKIVCPLDFSDKSFKALKIAANLAEICGAEIVLLHIEESFMSSDEMVMLRVSPDHYQKMQEQKALEAKKILQDEFDKLETSGLQMSIILREGSPRSDIPRLAEEIGADLIVISSSGRDTLLEKVIGSTAEAVVRHSKIPVLINYA